MRIFSVLCLFNRSLQSLDEEIRELQREQQRRISEVCEAFYELHNAVWLVTILICVL